MAARCKRRSRTVHFGVKTLQYVQFYIFCLSWTGRETTELYKLEKNKGKRTGRYKNISKLYITKGKLSKLYSSARAKMEWYRTDSDRIV